jgi:hypothetical protein
MKWRASQLHPRARLAVVAPSLDSRYAAPHNGAERRESDIAGEPATARRPSASSVQQRQCEIGIRKALGVTHATVMPMMMGESLQQSLIGAAIGLGGALAFTSLVEALLFQVRARDPLTSVVTP